MNAQMYFEAFFVFLLMFIFLVLLTAPTVMGFLTFKKLSNKADFQPNSIKRLDQLEESNSLIVEDINLALEQIVGRLEKIEEVLEKEERTVKGFRK